jgi:nitroreductase/dihydropteridine reductase
MSKIIEDMQWRYACKKFDPSKKLSETEVNSLLESLRLTASSYGLQPWSFVHVKNKDLRAKLVEHCWGQKQVEDASDLIVLCAKINHTETEVDAYIKNTAETRGQSVEELEGFKKMLMMTVGWDDDRKKAWMDKQVYIAMGTLLTACANMRIDSCPMEGFKPARVDEVLGLKEMGLRSVLLCPVGHRAEDDPYADKAKVRFSKPEIIKTLS